MDLLVLSGGRHAYHETTPILVDFVRAAGHGVEVTEDASALVSDGMKAHDAVVFNTRRTEELTLAEYERAALAQFIGGGKGFACIHIAGCWPDDWHDYHDITGGGWVPGSSVHPPYGEFTVEVRGVGHPCARDLTDFVTSDELYYKLAWKPGNAVFLTTRFDGADQPMAWTRPHGSGRVFTTALGHDGLSFQTSGFQRLILNGIAWATRADER